MCSCHLLSLCFLSTFSTLPSPFLASWLPSYFLHRQRRWLLRTCMLTISTAWKTLCPDVYLDVPLAAFRSLPNISSSEKPFLTTHININIRSRSLSLPIPIFPSLALTIISHYMTHWDVHLPMSPIPTEM